MLGVGRCSVAEPLSPSPRFPHLGHVGYDSGYHTAFDPFWDHATTNNIDSSFSRWWFSRLEVFRDRDSVFGNRMSATRISHVLIVR